jgi:arsenite methyltransferase
LNKRSKAMLEANKLKQMVKEKYGAIAQQSKTDAETSCCGCGCSTIDYTVMADNYTELSGYMEDADLGLGCGLPTEFAQMKAGDTVVDLGSGAGNDAFVARAIVGDTGRVIGIDMTPEMIDKARANAEKMKFDNVEFRAGDIEAMPIDDQSVDVVVSNCVMNLVPNKVQAFAETFRILKPGGHFSISDIVLEGELPDSVRKSAEMYAGCVSGAEQMTDYLDTIKKAGFVNVTVQKKKAITLPDEILLEFLTKDEIDMAREQGAGIYSITVYADRSAA